MRIAVPLAAVVGVSSAFYPALVWMLLPASVLVVVHLYRRREPGPLRRLQGAKLGAFSGLASFAFFAVVITVKVAADPAEYRRAVAQAVQEAVARNPSPEAQQLAQSLFSGTSGVVLIWAVGMILVLAFLLLIGSVSGVLAATFSKEKTP